MNNKFDYKDNEGEAYIRVYYTVGSIWKTKVCKAVKNGIQGAIKNAKLKEIDEVILISEEDYYNETQEKNKRSVKNGIYSLF